MWPHRVFISLWGALPIVLVLLALRPASERELNGFGIRYGVRPTPDTHFAMAGYVQRGRRGRLVGAALGLSFYPVLYALGLVIPNQSLLYGILGYPLGAFVAAVIPTSRRSGPRSASLTPRRLSDYLPRSVLLAPAVAVVISACAVVVDRLEPRAPLPYTSDIMVGLGLSAVAAIATLVAIRIVVARPQPIVSPELLAVDDAMRAQTLHTLGAAGIAVALWGTATCLLEMGSNAAPAWLHDAGFDA